MRVTLLVLQNTLKSIQDIGFKDLSHWKSVALASWKLIHASLAHYRPPLW